MAIEDVLAQQGVLRELVIGSGFVIFAFSLYFGTQFVYESLKRRKEQKSWNLYLSWILFFLLFAVKEILFLITDFYPALYAETMTRAAMQKFGLFFSIASILAFSIPVERLVKMIPYLNSTAIIFIGVVAIFVDFNVDFVFLLISIISLVILAIFYFVVTVRIKGESFLRHKLYFVLFGFSILLFANAFLSETLLEIFGLSYRLIGNLIIIAALFFLQFSFYYFPSLFEFEWNKFLKSLYVISSNGIKLYSKEFNQKDQYRNENEREVESDFIAAAFTGITSIISEITGTPGKLHTIDQGDTQLIITGDENLKLFLLTTEDLEIFHAKLERLYYELVELYGDILVGWGGNMSIFQPVEKMVEKIFGK